MSVIETPFIKLTLWCERKRCEESGVAFGTSRNDAGALLVRSGWRLAGKSVLCPKHAAQFVAKRNALRRAQRDTEGSK